MGVGVMISFAGNEIGPGTMIETGSVSQVAEETGGVSGNAIKGTGRDTRVRLEVSMGGGTLLIETP